MVLELKSARAKESQYLDYKDSQAILRVANWPALDRLFIMHIHLGNG